MKQAWTPPPSSPPPQHYPDHDKGLILMGDINVNVLKDLDAAEANFRAILSRAPSNVQAQHNLCVVMVERGDLLNAEKYVRVSVCV